MSAQPVIDKPDRFNRDLLVAELSKAGAVIRNPGQFRCPFHPDDNPSAGIFRSDSDGAWRFKCHGGACKDVLAMDVYDVRCKVNGTKLSDELPKANGFKYHPAPPPTPEKPVKVYPTWEAMRDSLDHVTDTFKYTNPDTAAVELVVFRMEPPNGKKQFYQASPNGDGWSFRAPKDCKLPIYNRTRVRTADTVLVVEGEKCVHIAQRYNITATCNPGGAGKAHLADLTPLAGKRLVFWQDHDDTGHKHVDQFIALCEQLDPPPTIYRVDPIMLNIPDKGDIEQFVQTCEHPSEELAAVIESAEPVGAGRDIANYFEDVIAGRIEALTLPSFVAFASGTQFALPGKIFVLGGDPGASKSLMLIEWFTHWHNAGIKVALFALEDDKQTNLLRALAQRCGQAGLTQAAWIKTNSATARQCAQEHSAWVQQIGRVVTTCEDAEVDYDLILKWMEERCKAGYRVLILDPISAASPPREPWAHDLRFVIRAQRIIREYGATLIVVQHPKKGRQGRMTLEDLAGGLAWSRHTHCVCWLEYTGDADPVNVRTAFGRTEVSANRQLRVLKCRNGKAAGWTFALDFEGETLRTKELGVVVE